MTDTRFGKLYWMDEGVVDDLPREKLIAIVYYLHAQLRDQRSTHQHEIAVLSGDFSRVPNP